MPCCSGPWRAALRLLHLVVLCPVFVVAPKGLVSTAAATLLGVTGARPSVGHTSYTCGSQGYGGASGSTAPTAGQASAFVAAAAAAYA
eukprot:2416626-Pleurochrysis_carterae.AAC.1